MVTLTLHTTNNKAISYTTQHPHLQTLGEFLVKDCVFMPDFIRALLSCDNEELIVLDACSIETKDEYVIIKHLYKKNLPIVTLSKMRMLQVFEIWENFLMEKNPTQWIFFKEEEFNLNPEVQWDVVEKKIGHLFSQKEQAKE